MWTILLDVDWANRFTLSDSFLHHINTQSKFNSHSFQKKKTFFQFKIVSVIIVFLEVFLRSRFFSVEKTYKNKTFRIGCILTTLANRKQVAENWSKVAAKIWIQYVSRVGICSDFKSNYVRYLSVVFQIHTVVYCCQFRKVLLLIHGGRIFILLDT